jgi:hypothetical protein
LWWCAPQTVGRCILVFDLPLRPPANPKSRIQITCTTPTKHFAVTILLFNYIFILILLLSQYLSYLTKGIFEITFEGSKRIFNTKKVRFKKSTRLIKKLSAFFKGPKRLKMTKKHVYQNLKNKVFTQKLFFDLKALFFKRNLNRL